MLVGKSRQIYFYGLISPIRQKELYGLPFHRQTLDSEVCQMSFRRPAPGAICEFIVWSEAHSASYCVHSLKKKNKRSVLILVKAQNIRIWCRYTEFCHFLKNNITTVSCRGQQRAVIDLNLKRHSTAINSNAARERLLVFFFFFSAHHSFMHIQIYSLAKIGWLLSLLLSSLAEISLTVNP